MHTCIPVSFSCFCTDLHVGFGEVMFMTHTHTSKLDELVLVSLNERVLTGFWLDLSDHALPLLKGQVIYSDIVLPQTG